MNQNHILLIENLQAVLNRLKQTFVGKDAIIDLMGICLVARENLFLLGPPGTAKSALIRELAKYLEGKPFEYLLTRFTEPNELFGPFDIRKLREGDLVTNTEGMLPEATLVFLDELLNANSAILNSLLMVLNERIFKRGRETKKIPALMIFGASNHLPEDEALQALFDRFLVRVKSDNVAPNELMQVLNAGWKLDQTQETPENLLKLNDIYTLQSLVTTINLSDILPKYLEIIQKLRNAGIQVSDRRAVKLQRLLAASALICKRENAVLSDIWVLRNIWDTEEQIEVVAGIVNSSMSPQEENKEQGNYQNHPQAYLDTLPDADKMYAEVVELNQEWDNEKTSMADKAIIKDKLRYINGRCEWIANSEQKLYVQKEIDALWTKIMAQI